MTKAERIAGVLFTVLGIYVIAYSFVKLDVGTISRPGSGFFTLSCGSGILIMALSWLLSGLKTKKAGGPLWDKGQWISPVFAVALIIVYALLMPSAGYILSTAVFIVLWQLIIARGRLLTIILFTVIGSGAMYVLFERLLSVPLPNGLLGF
jgi:hypothetical protein